MESRITTTEKVDEGSDATGGRHRRLVEALEETVANVVPELGLELVALHLKGSSKRRILRIDVDRAGPKGIDVEDCKRVSERVGAELESVDLIDGAYVLEVSSPGIDRPIVSDDDYRRNTGRLVKAQIEAEDGGLELLVGTLIGVDGDCAVVRDKAGEEQSIPRSSILSLQQEVEF